MKTQKTEVSTETKEAVFAQYWGQNIVGYNPGFFGKGRNTVDIVTLSYPASKYSYLKLKPLSAITDGDAVELIKLFSPDATDIYLSNGIIHWEYEFMGEQFENATDMTNIKDICYPPCVYQFLQSLGYDLPHYLLNGQTLKEAGLAVYE